MRQTSRDRCNDSSDHTTSLSGAVEFHDNLAANWESKYSQTSFNQRAETFRSVLSGFTLGGERWIDAGCGTGTLSRMLSEFGAEVTGFDASPQMVDFATRHAVESEGSNRINYEVVPSIESLPLSNASIDGVLCSSVLEYLDTPENALFEFARVLRPGGKLVLTVPHKRSLLVSLQRCMFWLSSRVSSQPTPAYMIHSRNRFCRREIISLMSRYGFDVDSVLFTSFWPASVRIGLCGNICLYSGTFRGESQSLGNVE